VIAGLIGVEWAIGGAAAGMLLFAWWLFRRYPELREL